MSVNSIVCMSGWSCKEVFNTVISSARVQITKITNTNLMHQDNNITLVVYLSIIQVFIFYFTYISIYNCTIATVALTHC